MNGFSLAELLITLGLVALLSLSMAGSVLYSQHHSAELNQIKLAEQFLQNFYSESWQENIGAELIQWQQQVQHALPGAQLNAAAHRLEISWPSMTTLSINCAQTLAKKTCVGIEV